MCFNFGPKNRYPDKFDKLSLNITRHKGYHILNIIQCITSPRSVQDTVQSIP